MNTKLTYLLSTVFFLMQLLSDISICTIFVKDDTFVQMMAYSFVEKKSVLFFTPDCHDGTRIDLASTMMYLNQSIVVSSYKKSLPKYWKHNFPIKKSVGASEPSIIIPSNPIPSRKFSPLILKEEDLKKHFSAVVKHTDFQSVDCVVCMFFPSQCQFFVPFNKTVLFLPAHRFNLKRCRLSETRQLIHMMFSYPDHVLTYAGGLYDQEYIFYYTGKRVPILYSSSLFVNPQPEQYNPVFDEILVAPFKLKSVIYEKEILEACNKNGVDIKLTVMLNKVGKGWQMNDLQKFKAVIVFPYAVLSYYLNDIFSSCVPLFVPSPSFLVSLKTMHDYRNSQGHYCPYSKALPQHTNSNHIFSPESASPKAQRYWFKYATFYTPASVQFDSWDDLAIKLKTTDLEAKFLERRKENIDMKNHNIKEWKNIIRKVQKREMPSSYEEALQYFKVEHFY